MNFTSLRSIIHAWLAALVTPTVVIWLDQIAPQPSSGYVGLRVTTFTKRGLDPFRSRPAANGTVTLRSDLEFILNVVGYRDAGVSACYTLYDALDLPVPRRDLSDAGVALVGVEMPLQVLPGVVVDGRLESRVDFDLRLRIGNVLTYVTPTIHTTEVTVRAKEGAVTKYVDTFTVEEV